MGIFDIFKKKTVISPLNDVLYNCLFADNSEYFKAMNDNECISWIYKGQKPSSEQLEMWANDESIESRIRFLNLYSAMKIGLKIQRKLYFGTVLEIPMHGGYDILAFYSDKSARYYNYSGSSIIYENGNDAIENAVNKANEISIKVCNVIGPWDGKRLDRPTGSIARFTYLMSDGLYFGNGPLPEISKDPMGSAIMISGAELMHVMIEQSKKSAQQSDSSEPVSPAR